MKEKKLICDDKDADDDDMDDDDGDDDETMFGVSEKAIDLTSRWRVHHRDRRWRA
jgi:hypothetical protein